VRRADDEVAVGVRGRNFTIAQFLGGDESRRVGIAGRRRWTFRLLRRLSALGKCSSGCKNRKYR